MMSRYIRPKLKAVQLSWVDYRVMRRTRSSLMRKCDIDPKIIADQQGHTLDMNLNVYAIASLESRIDAVNQFESALVM